MTIEIKIIMEYNIKYLKNKKLKIYILIKE